MQKNRNVFCRFYTALSYLNQIVVFRTAEFSLVQQQQQTIFFCSSQIVRNVQVVLISITTPAQLHA
jgi:hypothetical protein